MTTASAKAKGRRLQQWVRDLLIKSAGLREGDVESRSMGANGVDVMLSPLAKDTYKNIAVECKAVEKLNVPGVFAEHAEKYPNDIPVLIHRRSRSRALATLYVEDLIGFILGI